MASKNSKSRSGYDDEQKRREQIAMKEKEFDRRRAIKQTEFDRTNKELDEANKREIEQSFRNNQFKQRQDQP